MVCFQTKNPKLGKFWRVLQWKVLVYFMDTWSILRSFGIVRGNLVYFSPFWYFVLRKIWQPCIQVKPPAPVFAQNFGNFFSVIEVMDKSIFVFRVSLLKNSFVWKFRRKVFICASCNPLKVKVLQTWKIYIRIRLCFVLLGLPQSNLRFRKSCKFKLKR
jgi:hypothetical protein